MKLSRPILIPAVLLIYLAVMAVLGFDGYRSGRTSALMYFGTIIATTGIIVLLHFTLKRRERLRRERRDDLSSRTNDNQR